PECPVQGLLAARSGPRLSQGSGDGEALVIGGHAARDARGGADLRRVWPHGGVSGRPLLSRSASARDRRGYVGSAAPRHLPSPRLLSRVTSAPTTLYVNGRVRALRTDGPPEEALLVRDGRVVAIG